MINIYPKTSDHAYSPVVYTTLSTPFFPYSNILIFSWEFVDKCVPSLTKPSHLCIFVHTYVSCITRCGAGCPSLIRSTSWNDSDQDMGIKHKKKVYLFIVKVEKRKSITKHANNNESPPDTAMKVHKLQIQPRSFSSRHVISNTPIF